jgi:hypothetical protein
MNKDRAQLTISLILVGGLVLITGTAICIDLWKGHKSEHTLALVMALVAIAGSCVGWLFPKDGNGKMSKEELFHIAKAVIEATKPEEVKPPHPPLEDKTGTYVAPEKK